MTQTERELQTEWRRLRSLFPDRLGGCSFDVSTRMRSRLGMCYTMRRTGLPCRVSVAATLTRDPALREKAMDTLHHEVAHALAGHDAGHGPQWKAWCRKLGADPTRLFDADKDATGAAFRAAQKPAPWKLDCQGRCGMTTTRYRVSKTMQAHGAICCSCDGYVKITRIR